MAKIIILTIAHGASHLRAGKALEEALTSIQPGLDLRRVDALAECAPWFRAYYNSYEIPLRFWPSLWRLIEGVQHQSNSTGPAWLYRLGGRGLFDFLARERPEAVIATEVGVGELAAMAKRRLALNFRLIGVELMDFNHAWIQPEFDLYLTSHEDLAAELVAAGAPSHNVAVTGQPIAPAFANLPDQRAARAHLGLEAERPVILVLFGGAGFGNPTVLARELWRLRTPCRIVFVAGRNQALEARLRGIAPPQALVFGWVENLHEWMAAADLVIGKPGGSTLFETAACGSPLLAVHPLPGNEERTAAWIEKWQAGVWVRNPSELANRVDQLLAHPDDLKRLRERAKALARPRAAFDGAHLILDLL